MAPISSSCGSGSLSLSGSGSSLFDKRNFSNIPTAKRRRVRSGGNVSTVTNNTASDNPPTGVDTAATTDLAAATAAAAAAADSTSTSTMRSQQEEPDDNTSLAIGIGSAASRKDSKSKAQTVAIFLKKTYKMIDTCEPSIAAWTADGETFVVKDPDLFATQIIPQYFDHNKFSSFSRQLNFYGFRKVPSKPIRHADFDMDTAKHVTFYNENFKRGRCDLLLDIQRTTRGGGSSATIHEDQAKGMSFLLKRIQSLEDAQQDMQKDFEERVQRLEYEMFQKMEEIKMAVQQQQQDQTNLTSHLGTNPPASRQGSSVLPVPVSISSNITSVPQNVNNTVDLGHWPPLPYKLHQLQQQLQQQQQQQVTDATAAKDNNNTATGLSRSQQEQQQLLLLNHAIQQQSQSQPTLLPHPRQKGAPSLPAHPKQQPFPIPGGALRRFESLRGISLGISRAFTDESAASSVMLNNVLEMLGDNPSKIESALANLGNANGQQNHTVLNMNNNYNNSNNNNNNRTINSAINLQQQQAMAARMAQHQQRPQAPLSSAKMGDRTTNNMSGGIVAGIRPSPSSNSLSSVSSNEDR